MRILVSTSTFPVTLDDGVPRFVFDLADALTEHAEVTVLAPDAPDAAKRARVQSLDVKRFSYFPVRRLQKLALGKGMQENLRTSWLARFQVPTFMLAQARATRKLVRKQQIDVVNAHWMVPAGLSAAWARGRSARFKLVLHVHSSDVYLLRKLPTGRRIARFVISRCDHVFVTSSHVKRNLDQLLGYSSNASIRSMGVHCGRFARPELSHDETDVPFTGEFPEGYVLIVGRLVEVKGLVYLVRAMAKVLQTHPGVGLVVVGDGPERENIKAEIKRLGLETSVKLLGRKPHSEVVQLLHNCRVATVPSIIDGHGQTEGMPTVVVEAMAAGVRIVASDVAGIPDVVRHGENGWLCRPGDPDDLAEKLITALGDGRPSRIVDSALETAKRYDWRAIAREYVQRIDCLNGHDRSLPL